MSLLNYLRFQPIDSANEEIPDTHRNQDDITIDEPVDEGSLENYWEKVVEDVRKDPDWFKFSDK